MIRNQEIRSPLGTQAGGTLYDKLNLLATEISEGIISLSNGKRWLVEGELKRLKEESNREVSPEAVYNLLLFRKYSNIADQIQEQNVELVAKVASLEDGSLFDIGGSTIDGGNEAVLAGFDALKSNLFWLRVLAAMFSFISFVVMSMVPHVPKAHFTPSDYFEYNCTYANRMNGSFNMRPYQFVVGAGVLIYIHTLVTSMYYLLPVDENNQKYVPGLRTFMETWIDNAEQTEEIMNSLGAFVRTVTRFLEFLADFTLLALALIAFILGAVAVEQPTRFTVDSIHVQYYTMESYYLTFSHTAPQCVTDDDPTALIRASLAMLFFASVVMFVCLQVSWRTVRQEFTHRTPPTGHRASDIGSRGLHTIEGREAFLAQPLATSDHNNDEEETGGGRGGKSRSGRGGGGGGEDGGGDSDDYDEEIAVNFNISSVRPTQPVPASVGTPKSTATTTNAPGKAAAVAAVEASPAATVPGARRGLGAAMRNHEGQRFAAAVAKEGHSTYTKGKRDTTVGQADSESEFEETDL